VRFFRLLSAAVGLAFLAFAVLQHNDPDPALWMAVYGLVALLSFLAALERLRHRPAFAVALGLGVLLWWIAEPARPLDVDDEVVREEMGLALATAWTLVLAFAAQRVSARRLIEGA